MSSVGSLGGEISQRLQIPRDNRANQTADSGAASRTRPPRGPPPTASDPSATGSVDASGAPAGTGGISGASAKVISDLKALFIDLQSGTNGATPAQPGLQAPTGGHARVGGHHGGHHSYAPQSASPSATAGTSAGVAALAGQPAPKRPGW